jgi:hypothetical protein
MKFLAIEYELIQTDWSKQEKLLEEEARTVLDLMHKGIIKEIYFNENKNAVVILECENKKKASEALNQLPLVQNELIMFSIMELNNYTGFKRLL